MFDTLSAGFAIVNRHPWIMVIPILLDFLFWLGPRLSVAPLVQRAFGDGSSAGLPANLLEGSESAAGLIESGESFNLLALLALHYPGLPSLMATRESMGGVVETANPFQAMGLLLLIPLLGIGIAALYYVLIARQVMRRDEGPERLLGRARRSWSRLIGFLFLLIGVTLLLGMPLMVVALLLGASSGLFGLVVTALWVAAIWVQFYLFFLVDAIVISDVGPLRAAKNSIGIVRAHLGSTLGLVILVWIITLGMPIVWDRLAGSAPGTVMGILGNAYITAGLAAASMIYYRDRIATIRQD